MKSDSQIEEIKARIDIHSLVSEYVDLKRSGSNYKGLCPFHAEKTPSFMVSPAKQIFHCFGCNKGGDIFTFIMNQENMSFAEALAHLADKAGVQLADTGRSDPDRGLKENILKINDEAVRFFAKGLTTSKNSLAYLKERDIKDETVAQFALGYARPERDALLRHLRAVGYSDNLIRASGLAYFGNDGAHDFFRDRLIFPIYDLRGKAVAFGGRTMSQSKNIPKYLNSSESPVFRKSDTCYALNLAKNSIVQKGYSMVVEGYFDVISCHQAGFTNAVAPLGTALTAGHLRRLRKLASKVLLTFDADNAGIAAAMRSMELAYAEGMVSKVALLSEGEDPDTYIRKFGAEGFKKAIGKAISPVQFFVTRGGKNRIEGIRRFLTTLSACPDTLLRDEALRELSDLASEKVLREELSNIQAKSAGSGQRMSVPDRPMNAVSQEISKEEKILLNIALSLPRISRRIAECLTIDDLESPVTRKIFDNVMTMTEEEEITQEAMLKVCGPDEMSVVTRLTIEPNIDMDHVIQNVNECLREIALKALAARMAEAKSAGNTEAIHELLQEKKKLVSKQVALFSLKQSK